MLASSDSIPTTIVSTTEPPLQHQSFANDYHLALRELTRALQSGPDGEWGTCAETVLSLVDGNSLGLVNGAVGAQCIATQSPQLLTNFLRQHLERKRPARSIFTGSLLGRSGLSVAELFSAPERTMELRSSRWCALGMLNGISSLLPLLTKAVQYGFVSCDVASTVRNQVEDIVMQSVGPVASVESHNLYSFPAGITGIIALGCDEYSSNSFERWAHECVEEMLSRLVSREEGAFVSDGRRLLPYIDHGTSGVLLAMKAISEKKWPSHWFARIPEMMRAITPRFTVEPGFAEGSAGLIFTAARVGAGGASADDRQRLDQLVNDLISTRLFRTTFRGQPLGIHLMSRGALAVSRDLWRGTAGAVVALRELHRCNRGRSPHGSLFDTLFDHAKEN